jgi:hypothetical protein
MARCSSARRVLCVGHAVLYCIIHCCNEYAPTRRDLPEHLVVRTIPVPNMLEIAIAKSDADPARWPAGWLPHAVSITENPNYNEKVYRYVKCHRSSDRGRLSVTSIHVVGAIRSTSSSWKKLANTWQTPWVIPIVSFGTPSH